MTEGSFRSESDPKTTLFSPGVIDNGTGYITLVTDSFVDLPPGPSGSGMLADISVTVLAPGVSPLTLSNVFLNFSGSGFLTTGGLVTITGASVPEPMAVTVLAVDLGATIGHYWRRRRLRRGDAQTKSPRTLRERATQSLNRRTLR